MIRRHIPLYVLTQFFDYLGSIINYAAVGGAILYLSKAEGMEQAEIAALVARGSYSCLYLINAFSQVKFQEYYEHDGSDQSSCNRDSRGEAEWGQRLAVRDSDHTRIRGCFGYLFAFFFCLLRHLSYAVSPAVVRP